MVSYTINIPQPSDFPANSQPLILGNFNYLCGTASKGLLHDHNMTLNTANAGDGTHNQVTFNVNQTSPGFTGGVSVIYPNLSNGGSQLFFNNALKDAQLAIFTANVPTASQLGITSLPGGLVLIWNQQIINDGTVIDFSSLITLSTNCYVAQCTFAASGQRGFLTTLSQSPTGFTVQCKNTSGISFNGVTINWIVIGKA